MQHAKAACALPAAQSTAEQNAVEQAFYSSYQLKLPYHGNYWIGAQIGKGKWPNFYWVDKTIPYDASAYMAWGTWRPLQGSSTQQEPNNNPVPENCAVGNWTERHQSPQVFGWADTFCGGKFPAICKRRRE